MIFCSILRRKKGRGTNFTFCSGSTHSGFTWRHNATISWQTSDTGDYDWPSSLWQPDGYACPELNPSANPTPPASSPTFTPATANFKLPHHPLSKKPNLFTLRYNTIQKLLPTTRRRVNHVSQKDDILCASTNIPATLNTWTLILAHFNIPFFIVFHQ